MSRDGDRPVSTLFPVTIEWLFEAFTSRFQLFVYNHLSAAPKKASTLPVSLP
jgi:hypothetical protein